MALLVVFAGLPGSGKSVLSRATANAIGATYLRIDTIEAAIATTLTTFHGNPVGYVVAERVATDQLIAGRDVVADAVNGVAPARAGWADVAARTGARLRFVEVHCSDAAEHRRRVESRAPEMPGHGVPHLGAGTAPPLRALADGVVRPPHGRQPGRPRRARRPDRPRAVRHPALTSRSDPDRRSA